MLKDNRGLGSLVVASGRDNLSVICRWGTAMGKCIEKDFV